MNSSSLLTEIVNLTRRSIPYAMEDQVVQITTQCCRNESLLPCLAADLCSSICNTTVFYPPSDLDLIRSPSGPWREGWRNASLTCRSNGFPPPRVSWRKVQEDTSPGIVLANGTGSSRLSFRELDHGQSGVYRCESHGYLERTTAKSFNMSVQYPPEIDRRISSVHANEGSVATLPCIVDANPSTQSMITWHNQNQSRIVSENPFLIALVSLDGTSGRLESKLSFIVDRKLFGNYSCTAKNTLGSDSIIIQLSGYSYPDTPYDLQVISYSDTSLILSWTAGQDGGLPVAFTVTYCSNISQVERVCKMKQAILTTHVVVTELRSYTSYSITLIAVNGVGNSKAGAEIIASTAPGTLAFYGITARYEMSSGIIKLSFSELRPLPPDLCIYAEFHVGGFRHRNETCLRPGQIGHIQNGARENQLWLVICGKGVCSTRSSATYTDGDTDLWRLMVIVVPVFSCFVVCILLVLLVACIRRRIRRRRMAYQLDAIQPGKSPADCPPRILPSPPTKRSGEASESPTTPECTETIIGEGYEMMEIKCADKVPPVSYLLPGRAPPSVSGHPQRPPSGDDRALSASNQGYVPMDNTCIEGIYMTHLRHDLRPEVEDESTSGSGAPDLKTFPWTKEGIADDSDGDVYDIDSLNDTYAVGEQGESEVLHHEYLKASGSQASMVLETAV
ncbi:uncharacterized protein LOC135153997 [Lytechinus pictus]|uniref:uncharacterized protein LOC135153997 n=1 Tax=Lytechinus pictus TaxID=7653 RepID=UPI0030B9AE7B